jgi:uncharacterized protein GlcG (DUF336 family)
VKIPFPLSRLLGSVAENAAVDMGVAMSIAVVDHEGLLQYFARMDGALPASAELAVSKAYTAAALRMSTREVGQLALPGSPLYGIQHTHAGKIILFGGGFPLKLQGTVAGGIGISGGTVEEDERIAAAVLDILVEMEDLAESLKPLLPAKPGGTSVLSHWERGMEQAFLKEGGFLAREIALILSGAFIIATAVPG